MAASRARISDILVGGLHLLDGMDADHAAAKAERVLPASAPLVLPAEDQSVSLRGDLFADGPASTTSGITDGTSNTIMFSERVGADCSAGTPVQSISDGTSNTIMSSERVGADGSAGTLVPSISDGTSNTILLSEDGGRGGSARPIDAPVQSISDGTSNTILFPEEDGGNGPVRPVDAPVHSITDGTSNTIAVSEDAGGQSIDMSGGHHRLAYASPLEAGDVIRGFGTTACEQDVVDLDLLFDSLGVPGAERAARVSLVDTGADVALRLDTDGVGDADLSFLTFQGLGSAGSLSIGTGNADDIQVGA